MHSETANFSCFSHVFDTSPCDVWWRSIMYTSAEIQNDRYFLFFRLSTYHVKSINGIFHGLWNPAIFHNVELFFLATVQHTKQKAAIGSSERLVDRISRTFSVVLDTPDCVLGNENTIDRHLYGQRYHWSSGQSIWYHMDNYGSIAIPL